MIDTNLIKTIESMRNSSIQNYIVPGLKSSLVGGNGKGLVRYFECSRNHQENIVPHSHRFHFSCFVLAGTVHNTIWRNYGSGGDTYAVSSMKYESIGKYQKEFSRVAEFISETTNYNYGDFYHMHSSEIHSIRFSQGAKVLFFEGPEITNETMILEPFVDGKVVPTLKTEDWMFEATP